MVEMPSIKLTAVSLFGQLLFTQRKVFAWLRSVAYDSNTVLVPGDILLLGPDVHLV